MRRGLVHGIVYASPFSLAWVFFARGFHCPGIVGPRIALVRKALDFKVKPALTPFRGCVLLATVWGILGLLVYWV